MNTPPSRLTLRVLAALLALLAAGPAAARPPADGKRPMEFEDLWQLKRVGPPSVSPDGRWCVVELTSYDMDKDESSSDLWLLSTDGKTQKQLTTAPGKNSGPRWSPDGQWIAFVAKRAGDEGPQVYLISPAGGEARRLSNMPMAPAHLKWAANSRTVYCIAWTWPDAADDGAYKKRDKALKEGKVKAIVTEDAVYRYWDHWIADGKRPTVFAIDVESGRHTNLLAGLKNLAGAPLTLPPYEPSAHDYDVAPDGKELCVVADSVKDIGLDVNHDLYTVGLSGERQAVNITTDNVANDGSPAYSPDGKHLAFLRQTIKFFYADRNRLMVRDRATGRHRELTPDFDRSCASPAWLPDGKRLTVEVEDAGVGNIYFVSLDGGKPLAFPSGVTERAMDVARGDRVAVFLRSSFEQPPTVFAHRPGQGEPYPIEHFNDVVTGRWKLGKVESVTVKGADDRDVQMWVVYPPDFDPAKKWPLVQVVHGGPHNGITTEFSFRWNLQLWAARGWVIGCVNFHGSSGFGQQFTDSITGDYGTKPLTDVLKATDWFTDKPWIDKDRTAAAGASYGGYMMSYLNGHTDRFKAMVCHAGVYSYASQMASDIVRSRQRALGGFPWEDYARSDRQSSNRFAQNFKTPTLVIHGERDFRVPVTQGLEYYNTLKMKGVPARLLYFPDENHWVLKGQNSRLWHQEVFVWLEKYIGKGPSGG
jgi:dipeptidyl aminopeptidase/acylaminoacyl peptidase